MPNALAVEQLTARFGSHDVFRDLSFSLEAGSSLAVIGPNGAGKSVLFRALIGSIPYEGEVRWAPGTRLGYVPQKLDIERDLPLTGGDFLRAKVHLSSASATDIAPALERVGLGEDVLAMTIGAMSGGQFQRLLLAFALVGNPNVLMLDEPAAGVDEPGQERLIAALSRLKKSGVTILLISHDLSVVYQFADNALCLSPAHRCFGNPSTVLTPERLGELYGAPVRFHEHGGAAR